MINVLVKQLCMRFFSGFNFKWMNKIESSVCILNFSCFLFIGDFSGCWEKLTMYNNYTLKIKTIHQQD